ncbi:MAG: hypothetical protein Q9185_000650 [Variospora sp. 1 TL-2023]
MASLTRLAAFTGLLISTISKVGAVGTSGKGTTTRYWDCCKPSCAWSRPGLTAPVKTCDIQDQPLADGVIAQSGCTGGTSFMCSSQSPWAVNENLAYGFAAVTSSNPSCCTCYKLTFTGENAIKGKTMIVQATNTGDDVSGAQFDIAMPGGGFGRFDACTREWKATPAVWGAQYGGSNTNQCSAFPAALQSGCGFRWDWMKGVSNPTVDYEQVTCPSVLVAKSGCSVSDYVPPSNPDPATTVVQASTSTSATSTEAQTPPTSTIEASQPITNNATESYPAAGGSDDEVDSVATKSGADTGVNDEVAAAIDDSTATGGSEETTTTGDAVVEEEQQEGEGDDTCEV